MLEFILAISASAVIIIYRKTIAKASIGTEQAAAVYAEKLAMDSQIRREENFSEFKADMLEMQKVDSFEKVKLTSSEDIFKTLKIM